MNVRAGPLAVTIISIVLPLFLFQCESKGPGDPMEEAAVQEIAYAYRDSSVPPEYHRSYVITVRPETVGVVVDSYGEILASQETGITREDFNGILDAFKRHGIRTAGVGTPEDGCTGGTGERISCSDGKTTLFSGSLYHCAGKTWGNLGGDVPGFVEDIKKLVPGLPRLLE